MTEDLESLFDRRLVIQSGKGGTGKTTVSAALAVLAARRGKRVLLVEVDTHDRFAPLFGRSEPIGYDPVEVRPGIFCQNLDPQLVIVDFFKTHVRFKAIYSQILDSRIFQYFYAAAPGLRELICLGKVWRLLGERKRGRPVWDLVVMDAPATGHGLAVLNIAKAAHDTLFGPMKAHAADIRAMLQDPAHTVLNICAIPEEMPVNEACDLERAVRGELGIPLGVGVMNRAVPPLPEADALGRALTGPASEALAAGLGGQAGLEALERAAHLRAASARQTTQYTGLWRERSELPIVQVQEVFGASAQDQVLAAVARSIQRAFDPGRGGGAPGEEAA